VYVNESRFIGLGCTIAKALIIFAQGKKALKDFDNNNIIK